MRGDCMSMMSVGQVQISKLDDYLWEWRSFRREMSWVWSVDSSGFGVCYGSNE